jgi:hypothetical protein
MTGNSADSVEQILRAELARGDAAIAGARPVLRYLLTHEGHPSFSEAAVAVVRGMILDLASQLLRVETVAVEGAGYAHYSGGRQDELAAALIENDDLLAHAQALVLEADLAERLQARSGIDAVLPPLVQELAANDDETTAALAIALLAAQARFMQHCRRMELPLAELPGDLFHAALVVLRAYRGASGEAAERRLRESYDEGSSRIGLASRAVMGLGMHSARALAVDQAGVALFVSALAMASGQERDRVVLSSAEDHIARLALTLRVAGLDQREIGAQLMLLQPERPLPGGLEQVHADRAAALLASAADLAAN